MFFQHFKWNIINISSCVFRNPQEIPVKTCIPSAGTAAAKYSFLSGCFSLLLVVWKLETEAHALSSQKRNNLFGDGLNYFFSESSVVPHSLRCYQLDC